MKGSASSPSRSSGRALTVTTGLSGCPRKTKIFPRTLKTVSPHGCSSTASGLPVARS